MTMPAPRATFRLLAALLIPAYAYFFQGGGWNQNSRFALTRALVEQHTVRIDDTVRWQGHFVTGDRAPRAGHLYSDKAPGASMVAAPAVALASLVAPSPRTGPSLARLAWVATFAAASLPTVACALLLALAALRLGASRTASFAGALCLGLGTPAWTQATLLFGHALSSACLFAAFTAALALRTDGGSIRDRRLGWCVGITAGVAVLTEFPAAVPACALAVYALVAAGSAERRREVFPRVVAGALCIAFVLGAYDLAAFGAPTRLGYGTVAGFDGMQEGVLGITWPKPTVLWELLGGSYRGLFRIAPVFVAAPAGLWALAKAPASRAPAIVAAVVAAWYVLFNAAYHYWDGGYSFGPRHMLPAMPFVTLGLVALWDRASLGKRALLGALAAWGFATCLAAVAVDAQPPESEHAPLSHYLAPSFVAGRLARNAQSIVAAEPAERRDPAEHATNLGEVLGLHGLATLMPLFALWAGALAAWGPACLAELRDVTVPAAAVVASSAPKRAHRRRSRRSA